MYSKLQIHGRPGDVPIVMARMDLMRSTVLAVEGRRRLRSSSKVVDRRGWGGVMVAGRLM